MRDPTSRPQARTVNETDLSTSGSGDVETDAEAVPVLFALAEVLG